METYWFLPDAGAARRLLRVRLDNAAVRDVVLRSGRGNRGDVRVAHRQLRACYCCGAIDGQAGIFHPETIDHTLLHCAVHNERRDAFKAAIRALVVDQAAADLAAKAAAPPPPFDADGDAATTAWCTVMKLCTGTGPVVAAAAAADTASPRPPTAPTGPLTAAQTAACAIRDAPCLVWDRAAAAATSRWIAALVQHWAQALRPPWLDTALGREPAPQQALTTGPTPGQCLATLVADYSRSIFSARRKMLSAAAADGTSEFARLARDPPRPIKPAKPATSRPAAPKGRKAGSKPSAKPKRRPPPPPKAPPAGPGPPTGHCPSKVVAGAGS